MVRQDKGQSFGMGRQRAVGVHDVATHSLTGFTAQLKSRKVLIMGEAKKGSNCWKVAGV